MSETNVGKTKTGDAQSCSGSANPDGEAALVVDGVEILGDENAPMDKREAEGAIALFHKTEGSLKWQIFKMYERKAHLACGIPNFANFVQDRLTSKHSSGYIYQLLQAARVQRNLAIGNSLRESGKPDSTCPTDSQAIELAKLDTAEEQRRAWMMYEGEVIHGKQSQTPDEQERELRKIVAMVGNIKPKGIASATPTEQQTTAPSLPDSSASTGSRTSGAGASVSSFTPKGDPDPDEDKTIIVWDFADMEEALNTALTSVQNKSAAIDKQTRLWAIRVLSDVRDFLAGG